MFRKKVDRSPYMLCISGPLRLFRADFSPPNGDRRLRRIELFSKRLSLLLVGHAASLLSKLSLNRVFHLNTVEVLLFFHLDHRTGRTDFK